MKTKKPICTSKDFFLQIKKPAASCTNISLNFPSGLIFLDYDEFTRLAKYRKLIFIGMHPDDNNTRCYQFKKDIFN
jgi:hypothetical protein